MSISHELSGDIATALIAAKERSPRELKDLKDMLLEIHATLEQLKKRSQQDRHPPQARFKKAGEN